MTHDERTQDMQAQEQSASQTNDQKEEAGSQAVHEQLKKCQQQQEEWRERCMRLTADLENFRRRTAKEQALWIENAQASILLKLLDVLDNFDRALEQKPQANELSSWVEGFALIRASFGKLLEEQGVTRMDNYAVFNPEFHEALAQIDVPGKNSGDIVDVMQQGYLFKGKTLRPAKVAVAR